MIKDVLNTAESKMKKTISVLTSDLTTLKAGRANPKMLDRIQVEAYGGLCPIEQVGNIFIKGYRKSYFKVRFRN